MNCFQDGQLEIIILKLIYKFFYIAVTNILLVTFIMNFCIVKYICNIIMKIEWKPL
jgi:hypothetical protein